jgi:hypothetical protein
MEHGADHRAKHRATASGRLGGGRRPAGVPEWIDHSRAGRGSPGGALRQASQARFALLADGSLRIDAAGVLAPREAAAAHVSSRAVRSAARRGAAGRLNRGARAARPTPTCRGGTEMHHTAAYRRRRILEASLGLPLAAAMNRTLAQQAGGCPDKPACR